MITPKVTMIVDLQFGSTGKGLIAGFLAKTEKPDVVVTANMPNAGHTYIDENGRKWIHKVLPNGIVSPELKKVLIGPGAVFCPDRLYDEYTQSLDIMSKVELLIHPNAVPLKNEHRVAEKLEGFESNIGSTAQGSAKAMIDKINRRNEPNEPVVARDYRHTTQELPWFDQFVVEHHVYVNALHTAKRILAEGAQGYSLGINQAFYPYCTSRECTPARFMSDMGIPLPMLASVVGTARTWPIRVGGRSGGWYADQQEAAWADVGVEPETTTVTGRERRIATFSRMQLFDAIWECCPDRVFLNFANYDNDHEREIKTVQINNIFKDLNLPGRVQWLGFGPNHQDVIEI